MQWFRHNKDMRHRPEMTYIARALGAHGVAAAHSLLEVFCDLCGSGEGWNPTLTLEGAHSEQWLANEILLPDEDDDDECSTDYGINVPGVNRSTKRLDTFLTTFELAGFVQMGKAIGAGWKIADGKKVTSDAMEFTTITLLNADGILDAWTARMQHKGRGQGNGGGGYRS